MAASQRASRGGNAPLIRRAWRRPGRSVFFAPVSDGCPGRSSANFRARSFPCNVEPAAAPAA
ncbi:hypothetical protein HMPREF3150_04658 [Pseudomonas aeruginosa]|nr:hypothetical protein HMPREF3150_04658 [Pseudomonas aeruginosa]